MPAVSQALIDFANQRRQEPAPGIEVIVTPRYRASFQPDFPIPGPNSVSWIRCRAAEAEEVIGEARAMFASRQLPFMWTLDPGVEPPDFADHLVAKGARPDPHGAEAQVMVLPVEATVEASPIAGLEIRDALADLESFKMADAAAAEAFGQASAPAVQGGGSGELAGRKDHEDYLSMLERRRLNFRAEGNRRWLLATVDGEPAGAGGIILYPPGGAIINGGSVRPRFRGRGIYRALVAARLDIARHAGVAGLVVWGGDMSGPILAGLGFEKVGWRRFYLDTTTV
ncbi:MAG: GNAT family N-acetyltransferase [Candidatus Dormibacteraceae bacterium]